MKVIDPRTLLALKDVDPPLERPAFTAPKGVGSLRQAHRIVSLAVNRKRIFGRRLRQLSGVVCTYAQNRVAALRNRCRLPTLPSANRTRPGTWSVTILTVCAASLSGCGLLERHVETSCKSHAFVKVPVEEYVLSGFDSSRPVRVVVLPFLAQSNLGSVRFGQFPESFGTEVARLVQAQILERGVIPVVELSMNGPRAAPFNDLYGGNFEVIEWARSQGYDLVFVGQVEQFVSLEGLTLTAKLIDVTKQITLWYGQARVDSRAQAARNVGMGLGVVQRGQRLPEYRRLAELTVSCLVSSVFEQGEE